MTIAITSGGLCAGSKGVDLEALTLLLCALVVVKGADSSLLAIFQCVLGALQGYQTWTLVDSKAMPCFTMACSVPYAYRGLVEKELDYLVSDGISEPVDFAEWASPITCAEE